MTSPRSVLLFSVAATVTLAGCPTSYPEGFYPCHTATDCPPHWYCHTDLLCWSHEEVPDAGRDGGVGDAALDAGRDTGTDAAVGIDAWTGTDTGSADDAWTGDDAWTPDDAGTDAFVGDDAWVGNDGGVLPIDVGVDGCVLSTYYVDGDGDGYGGGTTVQACALPGGYAATGGDCNDGNGAIHPTAAEVCNGMDDDCSGHADDGGALQCVQSQPTVCTTTCGSTGTGLCSPSCTLPSTATCSPPTSETVCDGRDDNCNGVADEGLLALGPQVGTVGSGNGAQLVATATGYAYFAWTIASGFHMALLAADGHVISDYPLSATISPMRQYSVAVAGANYLVAYSGPTIASVNATGGTVMQGTLPSASLPTGYDAGLRVVIARSDATTATVYSSVVSTATPRTYALARFSVNITGAVPSAPIGTLVSSSLASAQVLDVVATAVGDYVVYRDASDVLQLVLVSSTGSVTTLGAVATTAPRGVALAITDPTAAISATNPLAVAWQDTGGTSTYCTGHFVEVRGTGPLALSSSTTLTVNEHPGSGMVGNVIDVAAVPNTSAGPHSGHWMVAAAPNLGEYYFSIMGGSGTPVATLLSPPDPGGAFYDTAIASGPGGLRVAAASVPSSFTRGFTCP